MNQERVTRVGTLKIPCKEVLKMLQFSGGEILGIKLNEPYGYVDLMIAHAEMPVVRVGEMVPSVEPQYTTYAKPCGCKTKVRETLETLW
jgi:hypothetical protein